MTARLLRFPIGRAPAPRGRLLGWLAAVAFAACACGGSGAASPVATATAAPAATPAATTPEATASPSAVATAASAVACTSQPATSTSAGWVQVSGQDGDYTYSRPADWNAIPSITIPLDSSVSPETFAATGLAGSTAIKVDIAKSPDNAIGISAWTVDKVNIPTETLFGTELAWLKTRDAFKSVVDATLTACLDGSLARGFSSTWTGTQGDSTFVIYSLSRTGKMYQIQMTSPVGAPTTTLDELLRTWKWSHPATAVGSVADQVAATKFAAFGTAAELDQSGDHPNPATFKTVFPAKWDKIYIVYELDDGVADTVEFTWKLNGAQIFAKSYDYAANTVFAWAGITSDPSTGLFATGSYEVTATLKNAGDRITAVFTVQ